MSQPEQHPLGGWLVLSELVVALPPITVFALPAAVRHEVLRARNLLTAAVDGKEIELFRKVITWSLLLISCLLVFLQSTSMLGWTVVAP